MIKYFFFSVLFFTAAGLYAQITVTSATFPVAGDTLKMAIDNSPAGIVALTPPGGNQTWDFSSLEADATQNIIYRPASEGSVGAQLPDAVLFTHPLPNPEEYYKATPSTIEFMAHNGPDPYDIGFNALFNYHPPVVERRAPVNFFDIHQISSGLLEPFPPEVFPPAFLAALPVTPDSLRYRIAISRLDVVDAWGSLSIPGGTYNVLREKRTLYRESRMDAKVSPLGWLDITDVVIQSAGITSLGVDTITSYYFHNDVEKEPIAIVTLNNAQSFATQVMFKNSAVVNALEEVKDAKPSVTVSPNPVGNVANFGFSNLVSGKYRLVIFDELGRAAVEKTLQMSGRHTEHMDLSGLPAGMYYFGLFDKNMEVLYRGVLVNR